jgi:hypothetical protein
MRRCGTPWRSWGTATGWCVACSPLWCTAGYRADWTRGVQAVAERVPGRDNAQCLQRWNKVLKPGLVKGPWSVEEDALLMDMMLKGYDNWRQVSAHIPGRTWVETVGAGALECFI